MARSAAVLAVYLLSASGDRVRAGSLVRDGSGAVTFVVDDHYLRTPGRPILSLAWVDRRGERETQARLTNRSDKIAYPGFLPPWFSGLLPEGALRDLVEREMGPGDHDYFDVLARLGADLAGAVVIVPETGMGADLGA
ncbi:MAG: HipA N-terminal domain-containing protein, partial [Phenylobacterium sp.]|nr:HipA N-terminal domain-containing protein [Phenylobacterium sp.]